MQVCPAESLVKPGWILLSDTASGPLLVADPMQVWAGSAVVSGRMHPMPTAPPDAGAGPGWDGGEGDRGA